METKPSRISLLAQSDELTELNENFNHMTDELKGVEYLRRDFTSNVSHEIKTPLATISGYARLLQHEGVAEADRQEYSQAIYTEATRLAGLSDNLLKLSRLESQSMPPSAQPFRLDEQIRCSITTVLPQLEEKGLSIDLDLEETNIESDEDLLSQVWTNLLTNAIKFTPSGGEIRVAIKPLSRDVAVTVSDTGIGMSAETVARAYEKFYQADASRRTGGSGLGLSLVKRIVGLLGGRIELTSAPGMGSTFCITLPKRLSASPGI